MLKTLAALCAACALAAPVFAADLVASEGQDTVRLAETACTNTTVLERAEPEIRPLLRAATAELQGHSFLACWRPTAAGAHLIYEDGDQGLVPLNHLRALPWI